MFRPLVIGLVLCVTVALASTAPPTLDDINNNDDDSSSLLLQQMDDLLAGWNRLETQVNTVLNVVDDKIATIQSQIQDHRHNVRATQTQIGDLWKGWNGHQWQLLQHKLERAAQAEVRRRQAAREQVQDFVLQRDFKRRNKAAAAAGKPLEKPPGLSWHQVTEIMSADALFQQRDEVWGEWIAQLMTESMEERPVPVWTWAENIQIPTVEDAHDDNTAAAAAAAATSNEGSSVSSCWTLQDAVVHMQQVLTNYSQAEGVGVTDHAATGGRIVHSATSPTYHPPPNNAALQETWGTSIWRDYLIPVEVEEYILPHVLPDWQHLPVWWPASFLSHSVARWFNSAGATTTAPAETILQGATWPGACWPMQGRAGHVTIVLPYPIHPTAITVDHVSRLLVADRSAAPKTMRVVGFAPCDDNDDDCRGLEYNEHGQQYDLFRGKTIEYDLDGKAVQTFWLPRPKAPVEPKLNDDDDPASCTAPLDDEDEEAVSASCGGGDFAVLATDSLVRAIQLQVMDNWGNGDYTCLYRIRVHGTPSA